MPAQNLAAQLTAAAADAPKDPFSIVGAILGYLKAGIDKIFHDHGGLEAVQEAARKAYRDLIQPIQLVPESIPGAAWLDSVVDNLALATLDKGVVLLHTAVHQEAEPVVVPPKVEPIGSAKPE